MSPALAPDLEAVNGLLAGLGLEDEAFELQEGATPALDSAQGWKRSGAAALTACDTVPPGDIAASLRGAALAVRVLSRRIGKEVTLDGPALLSEREKLCLQRHEPRAGVTLRGGGRMLRAADGWLAVNLPRDADWELVPALTLGIVAPGDEDALAAWMMQQLSRDVLERSALLGLAIGAIPWPGTAAGHHSPIYFQAAGQGPSRALSLLTVMDLSRLWAGPLAGALLASAGANVVKVESAAQPERVLPEDAAFARRLNGDKELLQLDFDNRTVLDQTLAQADVVIVSARQRAFKSLGLLPRPGQLWVSISAYGGHRCANQRVGFGDDAAAEAGAVCWQGGAPSFAGDALADPVTGLLAAVAAFGLAGAGHTGTVRLTLAGAARWAIRPYIARSR